MSESKKHVYDYPRPAVTVDIVVITREASPRLLLIRRKHEPFAGMWALPGGFIEMEETLEASARRELEDETGIRVAELEQLHTFGDPGRDPRGRTISVVYFTQVDADQLQLRAADDAAEVAWHPLERPPPLTFDHALILQCAGKSLATDEHR